MSYEVRAMTQAELGILTSLFHTDTAVTLGPWTDLGDDPFEEQTLPLSEFLALLGPLLPDDRALLTFNINGQPFILCGFIARDADHLYLSFCRTIASIRNN
jgi:hypothetical protein